MLEVRWNPPRVFVIDEETVEPLVPEAGDLSVCTIEWYIRIEGSAQAPIGCFGCGDGTRRRALQMAHSIHWSVPEIVTNPAQGIWWVGLRRFAFVQCEVFIEWTGFANAQIEERIAGGGPSFLRKIAVSNVIGLL